MSTVPGAEEGPPGPGAGDLSLVHDQLAVHRHERDALAVVQRVLEGGAVAHRQRIEGHQVGGHAGAKDAAVEEPHAARRQRGHLADRLLERQQLLVAFGRNDNFRYYGSTNKWTGATWVDEQPAAAPSGRSGSAIAEDPVHGNVVLFGGLGGVNPYNTWTRDGTTWSRAFADVQPHALYGAAAAFDPVLGKVVLFGGASGGTDFDETWTWDGSVWTELRTGRTPAARESFMMIFDEAHGDVAIFAATARPTSTIPGSSAPRRRGVLKRDAVHGLQGPHDDRGDVAPPEAPKGG